MCRKKQKDGMQGYDDVRMTRAYIGPTSTTSVKCIKYHFVDWVTNAPAKIQYKDGRSTTLTELFIAHKKDFPGVDKVGWNSERTLILRHTPSNTDRARATADNLREILLKYLSYDSISTLQGSNKKDEKQQ